MKKIKARPGVLVVLDGWGIGKKDKEINAIEAAKTPFFDKVFKKFPSTQLDATGEAVGLEKNQMSGSEAGHLNIGAGRVVDQDVRIILEEISSGSFFYNPAFLSTINKVKQRGTNIHLMGLMGNSDSPHSHPDIFFALLILLKKHGLENRVYLHLFTDGRDSYPKSAKEHWHKWKKGIERIGAGELASVCGRFYAMDRIKKWERLEQAYNALVEGEGHQADDFEEAIDKQYKRGLTDEYIEPIIFKKSGKASPRINHGDGVIFFNFRSDRARQFSKLFVGRQGPDARFFQDDVKKLKNLAFVALSNFGPDLELTTAYFNPPVKNTLPVSLSNLRQLYIAETEKFAHITYFINGGYSDSVGGEERVMINSPELKSYANKPEMAAYEVADVVVKNLKAGAYDFYAINFANADMLGHTGDFQATKKGVEAVDKQLKKIYKEVKRKKGFLLITADHGNADQMLSDDKKRSFTFHTKNPVPLILASPEKELKKIKFASKGKLASVAPTLLNLLGAKKPRQMKEESLIKKH
ncbi:MAG: 2,3-bisphosphoglycerate-independent phosphoglycerate mutase [Candidatus Moranbacteria bacterium]|nr:2,3-bisphosphoglycerate-independent phosphoglycerate mutase [Candidatus Moranbacteria bacterium]